MGPNMIAHSALTEGQGLRYALEKQQERDRRERKGKSKELSNAEKGWQALLRIESEFERRRAKLYLNINKEPTKEQLDKTTIRLFTAFRTNAFQNGLFMAFACLKERLKLTNEQFTEQANKWLERLNKKFKSSEAIRETLFDVYETNSLRRIYKPSGGLIPGDWVFFRYIILELLDFRSGRERDIAKEARRGWLVKLYQDLYKRKHRELGSDEESDINIKQLTLKEICDAYNASLGIEKKLIREELQDAREIDDLTESMAFVEIEENDVEIE